MSLQMYLIFKVYVSESLIMNHKHASILTEKYTSLTEGKYNYTKLWRVIFNKSFKSNILTCSC